MKIIFITILLLTSTAFSTSKPLPAYVDKPTPFGAFTYGNFLYVTVLGNCNKLSASLKVSPFCNRNRETRNLAPTCHINLKIISTLMLCPAISYPPQVFVFDMEKEQIAPEARELAIRNGEHVILVKVTRN